MHQSEPAVRPSLTALESEPPPLYHWGSLDQLLEALLVKAVIH